MKKLITTCAILIAGQAIYTFFNTWSEISLPEFDIKKVCGTNLLLDNDAKVISKNPFELEKTAQLLGTTIDTPIHTRNGRYLDFIFGSNKELKLIIKYPKGKRDISCRYDKSGNLLHAVVHYPKKFVTIIYDLDNEKTEIYDMRGVNYEID